MTCVVFDGKTLKSDERGGGEKMKELNGDLLLDKR
jgi:hypothetical protein